MTVVKINAITVREGSGDELARRFANRAGAVDDADGFEGFDLLRPTDERDTWLVITRWRDNDAFDAWVASPAFGHGHAGSSHAGSSHAGSSHAGSSHAGSSGEAQPPVAAHSELWAYEIVDLAKPA